jgi:hypothetical protein
MVDDWRPDDEAVESGRLLRPRVQRRATGRAYRPPHADGDDVFRWATLGTSARAFGPGLGCVGFLVGGALGIVALILRKAFSRA